MSYDFSQITEIELAQGDHASPDNGLCFMEMAAWFAGEEHSDRPECACPVLGRYGIRLNDAMPDELRNRLLKPLVPQIVGTRDEESELKRVRFLAMWATNKVLPIILRPRGFTAQAEACEKAATLGEARSAATAANAAANAAAAYATTAANANAAAAAYATTYAAANAAAYAATYAPYAAADAATAAAAAATYAPYAAADAATAANAAAAAAANAAAADAANAEREEIWTVAVEGLRQAILIGRHEGLMIDELFNERREKLRHLACAVC